MESFSEQRLKDKVALITGGASGICKAAAKRFAKEGADIIISDICLHGKSDAEDTAREIEKIGRQALIQKTDVAISGEVKDMVKKSIETFGKIDILVNGAGIGALPLEVINYQEEMWNKVLNTNLTGVFLCSKYVAREMIKRRDKSNPDVICGKIINISSVQGKEGAILLGAYVASKFGIIGLTQVLAKELAPRKINVNAICPGFIKTPLYGPLDLSGDIQKGLKEQGVTIALGRLGEPEDIVGPASFLASKDSDYITGQSINVCGGMLFH